MNSRPYLERIQKLETMQWTGQVTQLTGLLIESKGPAAAQDVNRFKKAGFA